LFFVVSAVSQTAQTGSGTLVGKTPR